MAIYRSMSVETPAACRLHEALGSVEPCRPARCPFWEPGGAVLAGRCALEHLPLGHADLWRRLLDLRCELEEAPDEARTRRIWASFRRTVDADRGRTADLRPRQMERRPRGSDRP